MSTRRSAVASSNLLGLACVLTAALFFGVGCSGRSPASEPVASVESAITGDGGTPSSDGGGPSGGSGSQCAIDAIGAPLTWSLPSGSGGWVPQDPTQAACAGGFVYSEYYGVAAGSHPCQAPCDPSHVGGTSSSAVCNVCPVATYSRTVCPANCREPAFGTTALPDIDVPIATLGTLEPNGVPKSLPAGTPAVQDTSGDCYQLVLAYARNDYNGSTPLGSASSNFGAGLPEGCAGCSTVGLSSGGTTPMPKAMTYSWTDTGSRVICTGKGQCRSVLESSTMTQCDAVFSGVTLFNPFSQSGQSANPCPADPSNTTCSTPATCPNPNAATCGLPAATYDVCEISTPDQCGNNGTNYSAPGATESTIYAFQGRFAGPTGSTYEPDLYGTSANPNLPFRWCACPPGTAGGPTPTCTEPTTSSAAPCLQEPANATSLPTSAGLSAFCITREEDPLSPNQNLGPADTFPLSSAASADLTTPAGQAQRKFNDLMASITTATASGAPAAYVSALPTLYGYAKLLYELQGERLTPAQQSAAQALYSTTYDQAACEAAAQLPSNPPPSSCFPQGQGLEDSLTHSIVACGVFASNHTSPAVALANAGSCFAWAHYIPPTAASCAGAADGGACSCDYSWYTSTWRRTALALMEKVIGDFTLPVQPNLSGSPLSGGGFTGSTITPDVGLQQVLYTFEAWYDGEEALFPPGVDRTPLWADTSYLVGQLWTRLNGQAQQGVQAAITQLQSAGASDGGSGSSAPDVANVFFDTTLNVDLQLLASLFNPYAANPNGVPNPYPLHGAPLLYLLGDTLQSISNRLQYASLFHDVGCQWTAVPTATVSACSGGGIRSEVDEMWGLFATLEDATTLKAQLASTYAGQVRPGFQIALGYLQAAHALTIEAAAMDAYGQATYAPSMLAGATTTTSSVTTSGLPPPPAWTPGPVVPTLTPISGPQLAAVPAPAQGVVQAIQAAAGFSNNYARAGLFTQGAPNALSVGLQASTLAQGGGIATAFSQVLSQLSTEVSTYEANQQNAVQVIQNETQVQSLASDTQSKVAYDVAQVNYYDAQIAGLEASNDANVKAFADFASAFNSVTKSDSVDPSLTVLTRYMTATVTPSMAVALGSSPAAFAATSASAPVPWTGWGGKNYIAAVAGTVINVQTSGSWMPTCALQLAQVPDPNNPGQTLPITGAATAVSYGQGYYLTANTSSTTSTVTAQGSSITTTNTSSQTNKTSICAETSLSAGLVGDVLGVQDSLKTSVCGDYSTQQASANQNTTSTNTQNGTNGQLSASFSDGIRLPGTPFPTVPTGALLIVQTDPTTGALLDATSAMQGNTSVLVGQNANVYLVVNDATPPVNPHVTGCLPSPAANNQLNLVVNVLTPYSTIFGQLQAAMMQALAAIEKMETGLIAQGVILPDDMTAMRDIAEGFFTPLALAVQIPPSLSALFNEWVDEQILVVENAVQIASARYQISLDQIQIAQYLADVAVNGQQSRYDQLLLAWDLSNMAANDFTGPLSQLLGYVNQAYYPAAALKYPGFFSTTCTSGPCSSYGSFQTALQGLINVDFAAVSAQQAQSAANLLSSIDSSFIGYVGEVNNTAPGGIVALAFPNPAYMNLPQEDGGAGFANELLDGGVVPPTWIVADPESSQAMWNAFTTGGTATITLTPQELYQGAGAAGMPAALDCTDQVPIIDNMALFLGLQSTQDQSFQVNGGNNGGVALPPTPGSPYDYAMTIHSDEGFAVSSGLSTWSETDPNELGGGSLRIWAGYEPYAFDYAQAIFTPGSPLEKVTRIGAGMSPFMTFDVNFGGAFLGKWEASGGSLTASNAVPMDLVLLVNLETMGVSPRLSWVPSCNQ